MRYISEPLEVADIGGEETHFEQFVYEMELFGIEAKYVGKGEQWPEFTFAGEHATLKACLQQLGYEDDPAMPVDIRPVA